MNPAPAWIAAAGCWFRVAPAEQRPCCNRRSVRGGSARFMKLMEVASRLPVRVLRVDLGEEGWRLAPTSSGSST